MASSATAKPSDIATGSPAMISLTVQVRSSRPHISCASKILQAFDFSCGLCCYIGTRASIPGLNDGRTIALNFHNIPSFVVLRNQESPCRASSAKDSARRGRYGTDFFPSLGSLHRHSPLRTWSLPRGKTLSLAVGPYPDDLLLFRRAHREEQQRKPTYNHVIHCNHSAGALTERHPSTPPCGRAVL